MLTTKETKELLSQFDALEKRVASSERHIKKLEQFVNIVRAERVEMYALIDGKYERVEHMFLKVTQKLPLKVEFKDAQGNPAQVDGLPKWAVTDEAAATLEVAADGMSATLIPSGPISAFKVQVQADADLGEGVKEILGSLDIEMLGGEAVSVNITAGEPVDKEVVEAKA